MNKTRLLRLLFLILACFFTVFSSANNFIVTSKADSGPGTLRDALLKAAANGVAIPDTISFNLPGTTEEDRTIRPLSSYTISSNLTIDASTQAGFAFHKSEAKVRLAISTPQSTPFVFFYLPQVNHVNVYGLFLINEVFSIFTPNASACSGFQLYKCTNIRFGVAGKGNYFHGLYRAIYSQGHIYGEPLDNSNNLIIQSNVFGYNELGLPSFVLNGTPNDGVNYAIHLLNASDVLIGGSNTGDKNYIFANIDIRTNKVTGNGFIKILNNNMGAAMDGTISQVNSHNIILRELNISNTVDCSVEISKNVLAGQIQLQNISAPFVIKSNKIFGSGDFETKISVNNCIGMIGGETNDEGNEIFSIRSNCNPLLTDVWLGGIVAPNTSSIQNRVSILRNTMYNNVGYNSSINRILYVPYVRIDQLTPTLVKGKATPNSRIHVYLDDLCTGCEGEIFLGETKSAADSNWQFTGNFTRNVVATATDSTGNTSEFTMPIITASNVVMTSPTCGKKNGSYTGIRPIGTFDAVEWHYYEVINGVIKDSIVSTSFDLKNAGPGNYYFIAKHGATCISGAYVVKLKDVSPTVNDKQAVVVQPSCGTASGSIGPIYYSGSTTSKKYWIDSSGRQISAVTYNNGDGISSIDNLLSGRYCMVVFDTLGGCSDSTKWFDIVNQSGPTLLMDAMNIKKASCGGNNGGIVGIKAINTTGSTIYAWYDGKGNKVGDKADLQNVGAGTYYLSFKDAGSCDTIKSGPFAIENTGEIIIDTSKVAISATACNGNTGKIANINVTGADSYIWKRLENLQIAGTQLSLSGMPAGQYKFYASNSFGCSDSSNVFVIPMNSPTSYIIKGLLAKNETCGANNGYIRIDSISPGGTNLQYEWLNNGGTLIGNNLSLTNIKADNYSLYATDTNGCRQLITQQVINNLEGPIISNNIQVMDDTCETGRGSIDIKLISGNGPFTYKWYSTTGTSYSTNSATLSALKANTYWVIVTDVNGCTDTSTKVQILNKNLPPAMPLYNDVDVARRTTATLAPISTNPKLTYFLYADSSLNNLLQQTNNGRFTVGPVISDSIFYIRTKEGVCYSDPEVVHLKLLNDAEIVVANAFSPNGDGVNDIFQPRIDGYIFNYKLTVFDRFGKIVALVSDPQKGWNGMINNQPSPVGMYYWIITGSTNNNKLVQQNGSVLLIR